MKKQTVINPLKIDKNIITRIPPSPTGLLHIGNVRTFLFNYFFTKQKNGKIILRMEDTDKKRSKKEFEEHILESLKWLGLSYDGEIYRQSERTDIYKKYLEKMIEEGSAYISKEDSSEDKRAEVIRFKNPNKIIEFEDTVRGKISFDTTELGDFVIAKSLEEPLYHLTVVVDDFEGEITHVIRGEDGISNTPRQILIQEAIDAPCPQYTHIPFILSPDRTKLSKRHGATTVTEFRDKGYLKEAVINYLALLGWNPGTEQEIFSLDELIEKFDLTKIQKGGAIFDIEKLNWVNKEHIKLMSDEDFRNKVLEFLPEEIKDLVNSNEKVFKKLLPIIKERIEKFEDVVEMNQVGDLDYYFSQPEYEVEKLFWKDETDSVLLKKRLEKIIEFLNEVEDFSAEKIKEKIWDYASEEGRGSVLWPMRYTLSGKEKSPDPFVLADILGKEETINRLKNAIEKIDTNNQITQGI
ncbi:MAG: glutamate--tRNA ligase [Candidatus Pacebacteria bacterium]|nr:glutamate--tRNA ligase [Candidatus Paceibacterota bacterium]